MTLKTLFLLYAGFHVETNENENEKEHKFWCISIILQRLMRDFFFQMRSEISSEFLPRLSQCITRFRVRSSSDTAVTHMGKGGIYMHYLSK